MKSLVLVFLITQSFAQEQICVCFDCDWSTTPIRGIIEIHNNRHDCYFLRRAETEDLTTLPGTDDPDVVVHLLNTLSHDHYNHFRQENNDTLDSAMIALYPQILSDLNVAASVFNLTNPLVDKNLISLFKQSLETTNKSIKEVPLKCLYWMMYPVPHLVNMCHDDDVVDLHLDLSHKLYRFAVEKNGFDIYQKGVRIGALYKSRSNSTASLGASLIVLLFGLLVLSNE